MRVLGVDPGLERTGYGCVDLTIPAAPRLIEAGVIRLRRGRPLPQRLLELDRELGAIVLELGPDLVAVESLFSHVRHARTAILMGHARGVILLAAARAGLDLAELAPAEVKRAVAGRGNAVKVQMQAAVQAQLGLAAMPEPSDVADAIAVALCAGRRSAVPGRHRTPALVR
ncbi:MAG: crossover junction endodeoxyribonuclease RuvC [Phycisphaeraceae bacterium]|nr:crossover junction endodeoxyribonuclease RuvC [Phycisphaeraceae bacterium]